jgi:hypothetical protein
MFKESDASQLFSFYSKLTDQKQKLQLLNNFATDFDHKKALKEINIILLDDGKIYNLTDALEILEYFLLQKISLKTSDKYVFSAHTHKILSFLNKLNEKQEFCHVLKYYTVVIKFMESVVDYLQFSLRTENQEHFYNISCYSNHKNLILGCLALILRSSSYNLNDLQSIVTDTLNKVFTITPQFSLCFFYLIL